MYASESSNQRAPSNPKIGSQKPRTPNADTLNPLASHGPGLRQWSLAALSTSDRLLHSWFASFEVLGFWGSKLGKQVLWLFKVLSEAL